MASFETQVWKGLERQQQLKPQQQMKPTKKQSVKREKS